ncbi:uroporphyrinogen decarboxylase family protein [Lactobacillaceae bacterium Scapto_B20]
MSQVDVLKAFKNEEESQVPFLVTHHFNPDEHLEARFDSNILKRDIEEEPKFVEQVGADFVKLMDDGYFTYQYNNVDDPNDLKSLAKIKEISKDHSWLTDQAHLIAEQIKRLDKKLFKFSNVFSAVTLFKWSLLISHPDADLKEADKRFADLYTEDPETVVHALKVINQDIKKQIQVGRDAGADGVFFSTQEIQDNRIGKDFFDDVQKQLDAELIDEINRDFKFGILHVCGFDGAINHLPWFVDYQLPVVNWSTKFDGYSFNEGKKLFSDKVIYGGFGNTTDDVLYRGTKEEIQNEVDRLLDEAGTTGVLIGADCTVPRDTPVEHIKWAAEAAHTYPLRRGSKNVAIAD